MNDEFAPPPGLQVLVEHIGARDWNMARVAEDALAARGEEGIAAAIWGLTHPTVGVRRGCAAFMDHHGTDACFAPLRQVALHDLASSVRRMAVHSATCQECKPCPLTGDLVGLLIEVALSDTNRRVRLYALWGLHKPHDPRTVAALERLLGDADPHIRLAACHALIAQDPTHAADSVGLHVQVALSDADKHARLKAVCGLRRLPQDACAVTALEQLLRTETDPRLRSAAHHALKHQDPGYKAAVDARARQRGIAAARSRTQDKESERGGRCLICSSKPCLE
jgi:hypothetical protein